jgi:hypothetical protein
MLNERQYNIILLFILYKEVKRLMIMIITIIIQILFNILTNWRNNVIVILDNGYSLSYFITSIVFTNTPLYINHARDKKGRDTSSMSTIRKTLHKEGKYNVITILFIYLLLTFFYL